MKKKEKKRTKIIVDIKVHNLISKQVCVRLLPCFNSSRPCFSIFQYFHLQILISIGTWWSLLNIDNYIIFLTFLLSDAQPDFSGIFHQDCSHIARAR